MQKKKKIVGTFWSFQAKDIKKKTQAEEILSSFCSSKFFWFYFSSLSIKVVPPFITVHVGMVTLIAIWERAAVAFSYKVKAFCTDAAHPNDWRLANLRQHDSWKTVLAAERVSIVFLSSVMENPETAVNTMTFSQLLLHWRRWKSLNTDERPHKNRSSHQE